MNNDLKLDIVLHIFFDKEDVENTKQSELKTTLFKKLNLMYVTQLHISENIMHYSLRKVSTKKNLIIEDKIKITTLFSVIDIFMPTTNCEKIRHYFNYPEIINGYINNKKSATLGDVIKIKVMLHYFDKLLKAYEELERIL